MRIIEREPPWKKYNRLHPERRKAALQKYDRTHKEQNRERLRKWRKENPTRWKAQTRKQYASRREHYRKVATAGFLKREYGLTPQQLQIEKDKRSNRCDICGEQPSGKRSMAVLHVDHKIRGTFRGLLCGKCNVGLGAFRDSVLLLEKAIRYIL